MATVRAKRERDEDKYEFYEEPLIVTDKAIIRVRRPILPDDERERRMKQLHDAAAAVIRSKLDREAALEKKKRDEEQMRQAGEPAGAQ